MHINCVCAWACAIGTWRPSVMWSKPKASRKMNAFTIIIKCYGGRSKIYCHRTEAIFVSRNWMFQMKTYIVPLKWISPCGTGVFRSDWCELYKSNDCYFYYIITIYLPCNLISIQMGNTLSYTFFEAHEFLLDDNWIVRSCSTTSVNRSFIFNAWSL